MSKRSKQYRAWVTAGQPPVTPEGRASPELMKALATLRDMRVERKMQYTMTCTCGHEERVEAEATRVGAVWECPSCKVVRGRVTPRGGGVAWVKISQEDVEFYSLLAEPEADDA